MPIYLDYNATAPLRPEALARMQSLLLEPANPSSAHRYGRTAKKHLEDARKTIADALSAWPNEIIFTASGSEANATALRGFSTRRVLVSAIEHSSILRSSPSPLEGEGGVGGAPAIDNGRTPHPNPPPQGGRGLIPVDANGIIDLAKLDAMLAESSPSLVSIMLANNETGVIQPLAEISKICKKHGSLLHTDAVQALGKIPVDFGALGADLLTISAHKCGGPLGAAALVVRRDLAFTPLITGGGQELGRRAGTENIPAIAGFATAVEHFDFAQMTKLRGWLDTMEQTLIQQNAMILPITNHQSLITKLPNTSCIAMQGVSNEVQLMDFDLKGFAVSAGSACSSGRIEPSHVLSAMGIEKSLAASAIRISGGWATTEAEIKQFTQAWLQTAHRLNAP